jgi:Uncharacterised nucleotidyltransferase
VPSLRFAHAPQLPALCALLADGTPLPHDDAVTLAAAYHRLGGYATAADPQSPLRAEHLRAAMAAALVRREAPSIVSIVAAATGAEPVILKGPPVAALHAEPSLRHSGDLDVLVPREAFRAAAAALEAEGFAPAAVSRGADAIGEPWDGFAEDFGHDLLLTRPVGAHALGVELHWRVGGDPRTQGLDHALLSRGAERIDGLAAPGPAEQLLVLAVHMVGHRDRRLLMAQDIALLVPRLDDDAWDRAFALARDLQLDWELHLALDACARHLGAARERPGPPPQRPPLGPLRLAGTRAPRLVHDHVGRLAGLPRRAWAGYARTVLTTTARRGLRTLARR